MIRSLMGAALSLAFAGAAVAEPFQSYKDFCVATNADPQAIDAAAKIKNWVDVTEQISSEADPDPTFVDPRFYMNIDPAKPEGLSPNDTIELLVTGRGDGDAVMGIAGVALELCGLMSPQADAQTLTEQLVGLLGPSTSTDDGQTVWLYSRRGDSFVSEAGLANVEDEAVKAAAQERDLYAAYVMDQDGMAGVVVAAVRAAR